MKPFLVLASLFWAAFVFYYYRAAYTRYSRHKQYAEYAKAVFTAVSEHFDELKGKSISLIEDLGYQKTDDSAWKEEVEKFITMIVLPRLDDITRVKFRTSSAMVKEFSTFSYNFILDLMCYAKMPVSYDLQELIASIEKQGDAKSLFSGDPIFLPGKEVLTKLAVLVLLVGGSTVADQTRAANGAGFSPMEACNALADVNGFTPKAYSELYEGVYTCGTTYKDLPGGDMPNNLSLYGKGTKNEVTRVRLMLNVNERAKAARDTKTLSGLCEQMISNLAGSAPAGFAGKVASGKPFRIEHEGYTVYLEKEVWPTGKGFELNCGIATSTHKE